MTDGTKRKMWMYVALFCLWTLAGLFMLTQDLAQMMLTQDRHPVSHHLISWMVGVWLWVLYTPFVLWLGRKFPLEHKPHWRKVLIHLPISLVFPFVALTIESVILRGLRVFPDIMTSVPATLVFLLIIGYHQDVLTYWTILGAQCAYGWYRRYEERRQAALRLELRSSQLERQLAEAHLRALKMQLQPHFLFNTLNTIMVLVRQQKGKEAEEMLARLSDLLRSVLDDVHAQEVPLTRELEYLQLYLAIEQVRFQDRLHVEVAADPEVLDAALPHMALQPIVENAIRHGLAPKLEGGVITLRSLVDNGRMRIEIEDNGLGMTADRLARVHDEGIGMSNVQERLRLLYGEDFRFEVTSRLGSGTLVRIDVPELVSELPAVS